MGQEVNLVPKSVDFVNPYEGDVDPKVSQITSEVFF